MKIMIKLIFKRDIRNRDLIEKIFRNIVSSKIFTFFIHVVLEGSGF